MTLQKQIIAMGGGGFSMEPDNPLLDSYVVSARQKSNPIAGLLPTASGDSDYLISRFYQAFNRLPCRPKHLTLFRQAPNIEDEVKERDALYVTVGNTRNMLAIWSACGMVRVIRSAWESGTVLAGLSAGAICWFEQGYTDSTGELSARDCLGFLPGSCSPHYEGEAERQYSYHELMKDDKIVACLALDDGAAAHFVGTELARILTSRTGARASSVSLNGNSVKEEQLNCTYLSETRN